MIIRREWGKVDHPSDSENHVYLAINSGRREKNIVHLFIFIIYGNCEWALSATDGWTGED